MRCRSEIMEVYGSPLCEVQFLSVVTFRKAKENVPIARARPALIVTWRGKGLGDVRRRGARTPCRQGLPKLKTDVRVTFRPSHLCEERPLPWTTITTTSPSRVTAEMRQSSDFRFRVSLVTRVCGDFSACGSCYSALQNDRRVFAKTGHFFFVYTVTCK
jgi:hypothetical protein